MLFTCAILAATGPLAIDMYLPGLPALESDLSTTSAGAQLTLAGFMWGIAAGQLIPGPLSDAYGRRRLLLGGAVLLVFATIACALAPNLTVLFLARLVQGFAGGTGMSLARAAVADLTKGNELARVFSLMMLISGIAPIVAPLIGGLMLTVVGWRGIFWLLVVITVIQLTAAVMFIPETLPKDKRQDAGFGVMATNAKQLLTKRSFLGFSLGVMLSFGAMFAYVAAAPFILQTEFGLSSSSFSVIFAANALGMMITGFLNSRLVGVHGALKMATIGVATLVAGSALLVLAVLLSAPLWVVLVLLWITVSSMGLNMANLSSLAISQARGVVGTGSAIMGTGQFILAGALSPVVGWASSAGVSQSLAMSVTMVSAATLAAVALVVASRAQASSAA